MRNYRKHYKDEGYEYGPNGQKKRIKTTKGYNLLFKWTDGQQSWVPLKDAKESYPLQVADFSVKHDIDSEPAFAWWVPHVLTKRKQMVSALVQRVAKKSHKFGVEVPRSIEDAYMLDEMNGNTMWRDAIQRRCEMYFLPSKLLRMMRTCLWVSAD